jgi:hypothetical protein
VDDYLARIVSGIFQEELFVQEGAAQWTCTDSRRGAAGSLPMKWAGEISP